MKRIASILLASFILTFCSRAEVSGPGLKHALDPLSAVQPDDSSAPGSPGALNLSQPTPGYAEAITSELQDLARGLQYNPTLIFNYVHDHIRHVLYFGSKKGAQLTYLEGCGNDFDQCSLLVSLLEASGYTNVVYQFGFVAVPYDISTLQDVHHWLGLSVVNTNWTATGNAVGGLFGERGYYYIQFDGDQNTIEFQHVWVQLTVGTNVYYLDPALKPSLPVTNIFSLTNAIGLNLPGFWSSASGTDTGASIAGVSESALSGNLQAYTSNLLAYLSNNAPNASVQQVIGGQQIMPSFGLPLNKTFPFQVTHTNSHPLRTWASIPTNYMSTFSLSLLGTNQFWFMPQLQGGRIALTFSNNGMAQLTLEDSNVFTVSASSSSNRVNVTLAAQHPYGGWNTNTDLPVDTGVLDGIETRIYQATNANYAITYSFEASQKWLQERQQRLDTYRQQGYASNSPQIVNETLNVNGLNWMLQTYMADSLLGQIGGFSIENHHRFGRFAQELGNGYYVDAYVQQDGSYPITGIAQNYLVFDVYSYFASALEYGIIEQLQTSNLTAASTVKMLEIASTNGLTSYLAGPGNWTSVSNSLTGYSSADFAAIHSVITNSSYYLFFLPSSGSIPLAGNGSWTGTGYVEVGYDLNNNRFSGMIIPGGYNGGFVAYPNSQVDSSATSGQGTAQATFINPVNGFSQNYNFTIGEPVRDADGIFEMDQTDLSLGQAEPRGISFGRHYESALRLYNRASMAAGWTHNYAMSATQVSAPALALGASTPEQMAPMIAAAVVALNLYTNEIISPVGAVDPKNWMLTTLSSKWAVDQTIKNSCSISLGKDTIQFVRQPDGSYTPPASSTMTLTNTSSGFVLSQRHGNRFNFATNGLLTNIVDQYGQTLTLKYNGSLLTNITDWKNRMLTLNYSSGVLSSVADSAGRSVSYGYAANAFGQLDLTTVIDANGFTNTMFYDTNHQVTATKDANGFVVVSNIYDNFGRVLTQYTDGDTNKAWQIYWSGWNTLVVDPAGGQQQFIFDDMSRQTGMIDAMSNFSQTFYDGQDHVVMTVSPLGETNRFIYDANQNLVASYDPLGYSNQLIYDSSFNLRTNIDARGNPSSFGYNSKFQLTGATNQAGNAVTNTYDSTYGFLIAKSDAGGTTGYGYDTTYGQLSSVTNPGNLGTNIYIRNALGDVLTNINARGFTTVFQFDNRRQPTKITGPTNLISSVIYDPVGNAVTNVDPLGNSTVSYWSPTRRSTGHYFPAVRFGTNTVNPVNTNIYDIRDWMVKSIDPMTNTTSISNDLAQRLVATVDPLSRTNTFAYDADGRNTNATDPLLHSTFLRYSARGEPLLTLDAATNTVLKSFDANGNQIFLTNKNGKTWTFQYDAANRLTNTSSPLGNKTSQSFDNRGLVHSITDAKTNTTTLACDARGLLTNRADIVATTSFQYDLNGNRTNVVENGKTNSWTYDAYDRVSSYTDTSGNLIQYGYDANGNLANLIYPGNRAVNYSFDSLNRLTNILDWAGRQTQLTYDLDSRLVSITRPNGTVRSNFYDAAGQSIVIVEQVTNHAPIAFFNAKYDAAGRVKSEFAGPLPVSTNLPTRTITYDNDDRMATFNGTNITNDANGNMTWGPLTNATLSAYNFDARNRLTGAGALTYGYDAINNRVAVTNGTSVIRYVADPKSSQVLMRIKPNGVTNYYVYGPGLVYEEDDTSTSTNIAVYHYDLRGSTIAISGPTGIVTDQIQYSAYGMTTYRSGTNDTPFLYNGRHGVQSDVNGLLFMRARYYNPYICRFINADPSTWNGGLNFYAFANGNPISLTDPFGLGAVGDSFSFSWISGSGANTVVNATSGAGTYNSGNLFSPSEIAQMVNSNYSPIDLSSYTPPAQANGPTAFISANNPVQYIINDVLTPGSNIDPGSPLATGLAQNNALNYMTAPGGGLIGDGVSSAISSLSAATTSTAVSTGFSLADGEAALVLIKNGQVVAQQSVGSLLSHAEFAAQNNAVLANGSLAPGYWIGTAGNFNGTTIAVNSMTFYGNQLPNAAATTVIRTAMH